MSTIIDVLTIRALEDTQRVAYTFVDGTGQETDQISYGELFRRSGNVAAQLSRYPRQARVIIILPTCIPFPVAFYGCLRAGMMAVPLPMPNSQHIDVLEAVLADCRASCILTSTSLQATLRTLLSDTAWRMIDIVAVDGLLPESAFDYPMPSAQEAALLQYTSGSTSSPKGVIISHENIMANQYMIKESFRHDRDSTVVAWAPLYHDQGLIGNLVQPLYVDAHCILMAPMTFLRNPLLWLKTITKYRAHTSGGPNFAYDNCIARYKPEHGASLDLSTWKVAFNGAEPINADTVKRFTKMFEPHGFNPGAFFPCYGLAEASLFVSGGPQGMPPAFLSVPTGVAENPEQELVCCGAVHPHITIKILAEDGVPCTPGQIGEICIAGPNVTSGYWAGRAASAFFDDSTSGLRFLRTGDLGMLRDEGLYVTGRIKELIILHGRNVYPYDIERTIEGSHDQFRKGCCAVFHIKENRVGRIFAVQEVERTARNKLDYDPIARHVRKTVASRHEVMLHGLYFVPPGFIPKTSSGKVIRTRLAALFQSGEIDSSKILAAA